jgi:N-acetyl-beta-hexosaminidase
MFPNSEYIHIGADESSIMDWNECPNCVEYVRELGIKKEEVQPYFWPDWHVAERFFCHFINKISETIVEMGRKPLVWEGFTKEVNQYLNRDITVMVFENFYQTPTSLIKNGFDIINCSWRPTYVVVPTYQWDKDECYSWDVGTFSAVHPDSPYYGGAFRMESHKNIKGGQLNAWGDFLGTLENGLEVEFDAIKDRLPAIAENT